MPKYAIHLESVPAVTITRNFLQPEEKWVVYESEPNVVNIMHNLLIEYGGSRFSRCYLRKIKKKKNMSRVMPETANYTLHK